MEGLTIWSLDKARELFKGSAPNDRPGEKIVVRNPDHVRPWQHVLESLAGYLCLGQKLIEGKHEFAQAWNFGPNDGDNCTVKTLLSRIKEEWPSIDWQIVNYPQPHEANQLNLDSTKARQRLAWQPVWSFDKGLMATLEWYRMNIEHGSVISLGQLNNYTANARQAGLRWSDQ